MLDPTAVRPLFSRVLSRGEIYLANHSLGRPLDRMREDVNAALGLWYEQMDESWAPWTDELNTWRANIARLVGISRADAIVPKTSAGQGLRAVLNSFPPDRPVRILTTRGEFDSIDFILKTYAHLGRAHVTWMDAAGQEGPVPVYTPEQIILSLQQEKFDLLVVSQVFFNTGQVLQNPRSVIDAARETGTLVLLDLYHAAGVIPLTFEQDGADFAIGGSYKYLRGGPGACYLAIHPRHLKSGALRTLDTGWFAKRDTFGYTRSDIPEVSEGGNGWLESTPPVLMPYQAKSGLEFTLEAGVHNLRDYSLRQQYRMREAFRAAGIPLFTPAEPEHFGAYSLLPTADAKELSDALKREGLNTDARGPFVRFGPDILNTDEELERAASTAARILAAVAS